MIGSAQQEQGMLWQPNIDEFNAVRSVVDIPFTHAGIDPEQRINLPDLANAIGSTMVPKAELEPMTDANLDIYRNNFLAGSVERINSGLYIPPNSVGFKNADLVVVIGHQPCGLDDKGVVDRRMGVVFPKEEFKIVARNARDFVKHVKARTYAANSSEMDRESVEQKANRAAARSMRLKMTELNSLESSLVEERDLLIEVYRQAKGTKLGAPYKAKNLDKIRKQADEIIHNVAETSSINRNMGTVAVNAMHRAIMSKLHRGGSSSQIAHNWAQYATMAGQYTSARRGKVWQSRRDCWAQFEEYAPALYAAEGLTIPPLFDKIVS